MKMKIIKEQSLSDFEFWSGAKSNAETLTREQLNEVESMLLDIYPYGLTETEINDLFWFDFETVQGWLGLEPEEEN